LLLFGASLSNLARTKFAVQMELVVLAKLEILAKQFFFKYLQNLQNPFKCNFMILAILAVFPKHIFLEKIILDLPNLHKYCLSLESTTHIAIA
jgi:hypothetical protein